ncbi:hypothetical protein F4781DRAFT_390814, partial [Annulohypoxylon bovei var. microspora]
MKRLLGYLGTLSGFIQILHLSPNSNVQPQLPLPLPLQNIRTRKVPDDPDLQAALQYRAASATLLSPATAATLRF